MTTSRSSIETFVEGIPIAQPRPRRSAIGGVYTPDEKVRPWKAAIRSRLIYAEESRGELVRLFELAAERGLKVEATFILPKAKTKKARPPHLWRPDLDNLLKAAIDALAELGLAEDSVVVEIAARKTTAKDGQSAGMLLRLEVLQG